jgi:uroporphyrin-III C-methyltransferase
MNDAVKKNGKVYLIGAGPGDPKLLTIKAAEAISASDVIVYDYLVNPEVLRHASREAELIYVGKRAGQPSITQEEINRILIDGARRGHTLARLKGGDPFIFGRGGEEAESLVDANIEWEIVPGVSSGMAAAAYAGIPLTHRGHSSSVTFITGHDGLGKRGQAVDWAAQARAADTLVIFMCAETIARIARDLITGGRARSTPIAIIRWGTYEHQEVYRGTLDQVSVMDEEGDDLGQIKIEPPAIAIVGDVVSLEEKLHWFGSQAIEFAPARQVALSGK